MDDFCFEQAGVVAEVMLLLPSDDEMRFLSFRELEEVVTHALTDNKKKRNTAELIASLLDLFSSNSSDRSSDTSPKIKKRSRIFSVSLEEAEGNRETRLSILKL